MNERINEWINERSNEWINEDAETYELLINKRIFVDHPDVCFSSANERCK